MRPQPRAVRTDDRGPVDLDQVLTLEPGQDELPQVRHQDPTAPEGLGTTADLLELQELIDGDVRGLDLDGQCRDPGLAVVERNVGEVSVAPGRVGHRHHAWVELGADGVEQRAELWECVRSGVAPPAALLARISRRYSVSAAPAVVSSRCIGILAPGRGPPATQEGRPIACRRLRPPRCPGRSVSSIGRLTARSGHGPSYERTAHDEPEAPL